jgi:hypothetical protein
MKILKILVAFSCLSFVVGVVVSLNSFQHLSGPQLKDPGYPRNDVLLSNLPPVDWVSVQNRLLRYKVQNTIPWVKNYQDADVADDSDILAAQKKVLPLGSECESGPGCKWVDLNAPAPNASTH